MRPHETLYPRRRNAWAKWFRAAIVLGIVQDVVLGVPALIWPNETLQFLGFAPVAEPVWIVFAALVLLVLAAFYLPAAIDPYKYPLVAWLSVLARPPGVLFFFLLYPGVYPLFGIIDAVLSVIQISLLLLTFYGREKPASALRPAYVNDDWKAQSPGEYFGTSFEKVAQSGLE